MKQSLSRFAIPFLCLSSVCLAHNGGHQHGHEGDERAHLMEEVGKLSEVTEVSKLEARDGLAWLHGEEKPYSGWVRKTWEIRHRHAPAWHMHSHPKQTRLAEFKGGLPTESRWLDKEDFLMKREMFAGKDMQEEKVWVSNFLTAMNTGAGLFMTLENVAGKDPRVTRHIEWHDNGIRQRDSKVLEYNEANGHRKEDFINRNRNGQVSEQGQSWRNGSFRTLDGKYVSFHSNGQTHEQGQYAMGKKDGVNISFYDNGQKRSEELWDDGKPVTIQAWKVNGDKCPETTLTNGTGKSIEYDNSRHGKKRSERNYVDGLKHGPEITFRGDGTKPWSVEPWLHGQRQGTRIFYEFDGSRMETTIGGELDGMRVIYNEDGSIEKRFLTLADYQQHITDELEKKYPKPSGIPISTTEIREKQ